MSFIRQSIYMTDLLKPNGHNCGFKLEIPNPLQWKNEIGIVCYPTFGGSGVVATELAKALAKKGHPVHFYLQSASRLDFLNENLFYHEVEFFLSAFDIHLMNLRSPAKW